MTCDERVRAIIAEVVAPPTAELAEKIRAAMHLYAWQCLQAEGRGYGESDRCMS